MKKELQVGQDTFVFDHWKYHEGEHKMPAKVGNKTAYMPAIVVFRRDNGDEIELSPENPQIYEGST